MSELSILHQVLSTKADPIFPDSCKVKTDASMPKELKEISFYISFAEQKTCRAGEKSNANPNSPLAARGTFAGVPEG